MVKPLTKPVTKPLTQPPKRSAGKPAKGVREDLERLEADYRAGILTTREIGRLHGISHARVSQYARQHGWQRNLAAKVQQAAATKLAAANSPKAKAAAAEAQVVDASAQAIVSVVLEHRTSIRRARELVNGMLAELEASAPGGGLVEALRAVAASSAGKLTEAQADATIAKVAQVLTVGNRANVAGQLVTILDRSIAMERRAFDLDKDGGSAPPPPAEQAPAGPSAALLALRERVLSVVNGREKSDEAA